MLLNVDGQRAIVAVTDRKLVAISATDGKGLWQIPYTQGRYNAATPIVAGQTVIYAGPNSGITAVSFQKKDEALAADPKWKHPDNSLMYNTPVLRDGWLYGISSLNALFCINAEDGKSAWSAAIGEQPSAPAGDRPAADAKSPAPPASGGAGKASDSKESPGSSEGTMSADAKAPGSGTPDARPPGGGRMGGGRMGGGRGMRGGGGGGYGSVVDAGTVLAALNPSGQLIFFEPSAEEFKQLAKYKVAESDAYAYPILAGNRVFIRDKDSVALWEIE